MCKRGNYSSLSVCPGSSDFISGFATKYRDVEAFRDTL